MIQFISLAAALSLIALAFILWPLLRRQPARYMTEADRRQANRLIYQERLSLIEQDQANGRIDGEEAGRQRNEAANRLLQDIDSSSAGTVQSAPPARHWWMAAAAALFIPGLALLVYLQSDSWMLVGKTAEQPAWDYLVKRMEQRVREQPADTEALLMLARTRRAMQENTAAIAAYARLNSLTGYSQPEYLLDEAETRILQADGEFSDISVQRLHQALAIQPDYGRALWYAGLAALTQGNQPQAVEYWQRLAQQELPEAFRKVLSQQLQRLGVPAEQIAGAAPALVLKLRITADPALVKGLPPDTPVFVMARPAEGGRAMLAVRKHRLDELPLETSLTDGMNMAGGPQLSAYARWRLVARIAVSGDTLPQSGDPYVETELTREQTGAAVPLKIDQRWP